jgi:hypothetical protein
MWLDYSKPRAGTLTQRHAGKIGRICAIATLGNSPGERRIAAWNERQAKRMPMLFSPTIGAAIKGGVLVFVGAVPSLSNDQRNRPSRA